ncbi:hypothetical protein KIPB_000548 [Kipferlia bialata]|uniref:Sm domain-containing protein n=1 Tax=Kipferlia bialata TaxID=797122 RepID=A0A9K3CMI1_9EUKA|nr:hypothetical protein KIPB_000548 [Kipferlia bialata]|eukprot:g548.t1
MRQNNLSTYVGKRVRVTMKGCMEFVGMLDSVDRLSNLVLKDATVGENTYPTVVLRGPHLIMIHEDAPAAAVGGEGQDVEVIG